MAESCYGDIFKLKDLILGKICIMCNVQSFIKIGILHEYKSCKLYLNVFLISCYSNRMYHFLLLRLNAHKGSVASDRFDMHKQSLVVSIIFLSRVKKYEVITCINY